MKILGLDPGSRVTGFGLIEKNRGRLDPLDFGSIVCRPTTSLGSRLAFLVAELETLLDRLEPDAAALETPFQGLNPRSLIVLAQARGALLAAVARRGLELREYSPAEVKTAVTGYGRAEKRQVSIMVRKILRLSQSEMATDASDALAVAICCAQMERREAIVAAATKGP